MDVFEEPEKDSRHPGKLIVLVSTALLGLIAVLTAWSGYQAAKWGGDATDLALQSNAFQSQSSESSLTANQLQMLDVQIFIEWVNATMQNNVIQAKFYQQRMRDEAKPAFNAWLETDPFTNGNAPTSPFVMPQYVLQTRIQAQKFADQSAALYDQNQVASDHSNNYVLTTVVLASAMFFVGISTRIGWRQVELVLVTFSICLLAYGVYRVVMLQIS
jgi:hypothetical protein